jgi:hypothetical protein
MRPQVRIGKPNIGLSELSALDIQRSVKTIHCGIYDTNSAGAEAFKQFVDRDSNRHLSFVIS